MQIKDLKSLPLEIEELAFGNKELEIETITIPEEARDNTLVFISKRSFFDKVDKELNLSRILFVLDQSFYDNNESIAKSLPNFVTTKNMAKCMAVLSKYFYDKKYGDNNFQLDGRQIGSASISSFADVAQNVFIGDGVVIEEEVKIHPGCTIMGKVHIAKGSEIFPNVTVYPFTEIGRFCRIHAGAVVGSDGFGYNFCDGKHLKVWHFGGVKIADNVEIGANTTIDSGTFTATSIGEGTKIDNTCQIAHNCKVGKHVIMCGLSGMAGSCKIDDYVVFAAGAGCAPGVHLKVGTKLAAKTLVGENTSWGPSVTLGGHPARPLKDYLKEKARLRIMAQKK